MKPIEGDAVRREMDARDLDGIVGNTATGRIGGALRSLLRRIENLDASTAGKAETEKAFRELERGTFARLGEIDRTEIALREHLAALDRTVSAQGQRIGALEGLLSAEAMRRAAAATRPAPSSPELEELRAARPCTCGDLRRVGMHRWYGQPCDVQPTGGVVAPRNPAPKIGEPFPSIAGDPLSPPPIARAIGRAVMAAAEKIGGPQAMIDAHAKVKAAATLRERLLGILDLIGGEAFDRLNHAIVDAQRAGVIP